MAAFLLLPLLPFFFSSKAAAALADAPSPAPFLGTESPSLAPFLPAWPPTVSIAEPAFSIPIPAKQPSFLDDFFTAANYKWLKSTAPPASVLLKLRASTEKKLRRLVRKTVHKVRKGREEVSDLEKIVGNWYISGVRLKARRKDGLAALDKIFALIRAVENKGELAGLLARKGLDVFFDVSLGQDKDSSGLEISRLRISPSYSILLPARQDSSDAWVSECTDSGDSGLSCQLLLKFVATVFEKTGDSPKAAELSARHLIDAITALLPGEAEDEISMRVERLEKSVSGFDFGAYFKALGVNSTLLIVGQRSWFATFANWLSTVSEEQLNAFLRWRIISSMFRYTDSKIADVFYGMVSCLSIIPCEDFRLGNASVPAKERIFSGLNDIAVEPLLSIALGQLFSKQLLPPKTYHLVEKFTEAIHQTFRRRIQNLAWMQDSTRSEALKKIDRMGIFVGAPQSDLFKGLVMSRESYMGNALRVKEFQRKQDISRIGRSIIELRGDDWLELPQEINAFYEPYRNAIYICAGILQPPFFQPQSLDEVNFGAIGMVIGHEMTHGFDNDGRNYDFEGRERDWWTQDDDKDFARLSSALVGQFNKYSYFNMPIDGEYTLGENIADLGGVAIAYEAWSTTQLGGGLPLPEKCSKKRVQSRWKKYSSAQRFFLSFARSWRTRDTVDSADAYYVDVHSPPIFRVNGPCSNVNAFYNAFGLREGFKMYRKPSDRIIIW